MHFFIKTDKGLSILLFLGAILLYGNTIFNDYNLDDELVTKNHRLTSKGISAIPEIFNSNYYEDDFGYSYGYRPVTLSTFAIEHSLFGENPKVSHAINVLLFGLTCGLLFYLIRRILPDQSIYIALLASVIFMVHPIHTEVVASIKNRDEILSLLFGIMSLLTAFWANQNANKIKKPLLWLLALGLFIFGCWSKKSIVFLSLSTPLLVILFSQKSKLTYPILYVVLSSLFVAYLLQLDFAISAIFLGLSATLIVSTHSLKNDYWSKYKDKVLHFFSHKSLLISLVSLATIIAYFGFFFSSKVLILLGAILILASVFALKNFDYKIVVSAIVAAIFYGLSIFTNEGLFAIVGLTFSLALLDKSNRQNWWRAIPFLVATLIILLVTKGFEAHGIFLFAVVLFFGYHFFRPLFLIVPLVICIGNVDEPIFFLVGLSLFIGLILQYEYVINWLEKTKFNLKKISQQALFASLLFSLIYGSTQVFNFTDVSETQISSELEEDRPILAVENPIINKWNAPNRIAAAITSTKFYLQKIVFPYPLRFYYGYDQITLLHPKAPLFYTSLLVILLLGLGLLFLLYKSLEIGLFISLGLLFLVPYSNLFVPVAGIVGERLTYVASMWFCVALALLIFRLNQKYATLRVPTYVTIGVLIVTSSIFVLHRNTLWKNKITLFEHDIAFTQNSAQAHALLAYAYIEKGNVGSSSIESEKFGLKAIEQFNNATLIYPDFFNWWYDKGNLEEQFGTYESSINSFKNAQKLDASFSSELLLRIAAMELELGAFESAANTLNELKESGYSETDLYNTQALVYASANQFNAAKLALKEGLVRHPNNYDLLLNLGKLHYQLNEHNEALDYFQQASEIKNSDPNLQAIISELSSL